MRPSCRRTTRSSRCRSTTSASVDRARSILRSIDRSWDASRASTSASLSARRSRWTLAPPAGGELVEASRDDPAPRGAASCATSPSDRARCCPAAPDRGPGAARPESRSTAWPTARSAAAPPWTSTMSRRTSAARAVSSSPGTPTTAKRRRFRASSSRTLQREVDQRVSAGDQLDLVLARDLAVEGDPDVPAGAQLGRQLPERAHAAAPPDVERPKPRRQLGGTRRADRCRAGSVGEPVRHAAASSRSTSVRISLGPTNRPSVGPSFGHAVDLELVDRRRAPLVTPRAPGPALRARPGPLPPAPTPARARPRSGRGSSSVLVMSWSSSRRIGSSSPIDCSKTPMRVYSRSKMSVSIVPGTCMLRMKIFSCCLAEAVEPADPLLDLHGVPRAGRS